MPGNNDITTLIERYLDHLCVRTTRKRVAAPETLRAVRFDLQGFVHWWEETRGLLFDPALILDTDILDWHAERQSDVKASTLNRARSSLIGFFTWAQDQGLVSHNPAPVLPLLATEDVAPRSIPPEGVEWLFRVAAAQNDTTLRARDLALLTLLSDCGLRSNEAASMQLRDLDLDAAMLTVRNGKGGKARRLPLPPTAVRRLRDYLQVRCTDRSLTLQSDAERELLLLAQRLNAPGQPWTPGMQTVSMRKRIKELGVLAAAKIRTQLKQALNAVRIAELEVLATRMEQVSPHALRHSLAYRLKKAHTPLEDIGRVLGHSRPQVTTILYGKSFDDDLRESLERANRHSSKPNVL